MNKIIRIAALGLVFALTAFGAQAQTGKIAVFSAQDAILNSELAKKRLKKLESEKEFASIKKSYEKQGKEFQSAAANFSKEAAVMSASQKSDAQKKISVLRADLEHNLKKLQAAQNDVVQKLGGEVGPRVQKILEELIKEENIGMILRREAVIHASGSYDITSKVTDKLNAGAGK